MPTEPETTDLYFVYGSLLPGLHNHMVLQESELVLDGTIVGLLLSLGQFPALVTNDILAERTTETVVGKVYRVADPTVARDLDYLEGYIPGRSNNLYEKQIVPVTCADGTIQYANVYSASMSLLRSLSGKESLVPNGDWAPYYAKLQEWLESHPLY